MELAEYAEPATVVDIGCGLGEVLTRIPARSRYGFDREREVIAAARFLNGRNARFGTATLEDAATIRSYVREKQIDLIIMTGWLHGVPIDQLVSQLTALNDELPIGMILIDGVRPEKMDIRGHYHGVAEVSKLGTVVRTMDVGDDARELHLVKLNLGHA